MSGPDTRPSGPWCAWALEEIATSFATLLSWRDCKKFRNVIVMENRVPERIEVFFVITWELRERSCNVIVMGAAKKVSFNENTPQNIHLQLETFRPEKDASVPTKIKTLVFVK
jgi:hypothetical protein